MGKLAIVAGLIGIHLPASLARLFYRNLETYRGQTIDVKAAAAGRFANLFRVPGEIPTVEESRAQLLQSATVFDKPGPVLARKLDLSVPGDQGQIPVRLYSDEPDTANKKRALVYFHGGGFIQGNLDSHDAVCAKLAKWSGGIVIAVDYRLAPEHPFPAGVDDAFTVFNWVHENAADLGVDENKIGVGGDSAGGCFAAVVAQLARDNSGPDAKFQVLIYPVTDARLDTKSVRELDDAYVLARERMTWYRDLYVGDFPDLDFPKLSPLKAKDFTGLPPALIVTGGFDPLQDDGILYAQKLQQAGVAVTHNHFPGQVHAFVNLTKAVPDGTKALEQIAHWLSRQG